MKKIIIGVIIGVFISTGVSYALRIPKPAKITKFDDANLPALNTSLENLWDITNGKYNLNIVTSAPTWTAKEGDMVIYSTGGVYRLYIYINAGWHYAALT